MNNIVVTGLLLSAITCALLSACGEGAQVGTNQIQALPNPLEPRYQASMADGITFKTPGYPPFVSAVKGISSQEGFGRWTDDTVASIEFAQPLPKKFTLKITATSYQPSMGEPIKIAIGGTKYQAEFPKHWEFKEVSIPVVTDGTAKAVTFELPNAKVPKLIGQGDDGRKLSLALSSIKIIEQ